MRGLRYTLKTEHAWYSGVSNQEVCDRINIALNKDTGINITWQAVVAGGKFDRPKTIKKLSEYIMNQQNRTVAHVVRAYQQEPMKQMTATSNLDIPGVHHRRVGRPRIPSDTRELVYNHDKKDWEQTKCEAGW